MREIIFKAKRLDNGEWIEGSLSRCGAMPYDRDKYYIEKISYEPFKRYAVDPETIGQFTGLKDKSGKEIYEGDKLKQGKRVFIVVYLNGAFGIAQDKDINVFCGYLCELASPNLGEIIGNIHDK